MHGNEQAISMDGLGNNSDNLIGTNWIGRSSTPGGCDGCLPRLVGHRLGGVFQGTEGEGWLRPDPLRLIQFESCRTSRRGNVNRERQNVSDSDVQDDPDDVTAAAVVAAFQLSFSFAFLLPDLASRGLRWNCFLRESKRAGAIDQ